MGTSMGSGDASMVPGMRLRLVRLPHPKKWSFDFPLMASEKCHGVAGRDLGDVAVVVVDAASTCSAAGLSSAPQSTEASTTRIWNAAMSAMLAFFHTFL